MARTHASFVCQQCGVSHPRWGGRCEACGAWNSLVEEAAAEVAPRGLTGKKGRRLDIVPLSGAIAHTPRLVTGIAEFDRVCGGGIAPSSAVLIGGDPGIGKSTLLLQTTASLARSGCRCLFISGEEAVDQVRLRAARLGLADAPVDLAAATNVRDILASLDAGDAPEIVVIDSIQTMYVDSLDSAPGTIAQVRASAQELIRLAKRRGTSVLIIGHVTKEGLLAGPRALEHMVDTVIYFEGERSHHYRILRAVKNRYGPSDEIGVFEMTEMGLQQVSNPSALFLEDRRGDVAGTAVFAGVEGTRPVLVEVQALVSPSRLGTPRRAVVGWDSARLAMVLAVMEARCGMVISGQDVYLNIAGGLRITEPAADLAVAAALMSSMSATAIPADTVIFGEIGLGGEVRPVGKMPMRLKEAEKLGFQRAMTPALSRGKSEPATSMAVDRIDRLAEMATLIGSTDPSARHARQAG